MPLNMNQPSVKFFLQEAAKISEEEKQRAEKTLKELESKHAIKHLSKAYGFSSLVEYLLKRGVYTCKEFLDLVETKDEAKIEALLSQEIAFMTHDGKVPFTELVALYDKMFAKTGSGEKFSNLTKRGVTLLLREGVAFARIEALYDRDRQALSAVKAKASTRTTPFNLLMSDINSAIAQKEGRARRLSGSLFLDKIAAKQIPLVICTRIMEQFLDPKSQINALTTNREVRNIYRTALGWEPLSEQGKEEAASATKLLSVRLSSTSIKEGGNVPAKGH